MKIFQLIISLFLFYFHNFVFNDLKKESKLDEKSLDLQMIEAYKEGLVSLEQGDVLFAAKKFNEAEIYILSLYGRQERALMAAYSYYLQDYYGDAIAELVRFTKVYPKS